MQKVIILDQPFIMKKELYWGVDRIDHLEDRLTELGLKKDTNNEPICTPILNSPHLWNQINKSIYITIPL